MKEKDPTKSTSSIKEIIYNNTYMLKLIYSNAPGLLLGQIVLSFFSTLFSFLTYTYMLRYALNGISDGKSFKQIFCFIIICFLLHIVYSVGATICYDLFFPIMRIKFSYKIRKAIYEKAIGVDLECYDNPQYYNSISKAIGEWQAQANNLINSLVNLTGIVFSCSLNLLIILLIDPILIVFSLIPIVSIFLTAIINKLNYEKKMKLVGIKRFQEYSQRTFYLSQYAKEMRLTNISSLMLEKFEKSGNQVISIIKKYGFSLATLSYLKTECIEVISILGATIYACVQTFAFNAMGYGDCIVVINSISEIVDILMNSADTFLEFQKTSLFIREIRNYLEYIPQIKGGESRIPESGDLEINNICFRYDKQSDYILENISMRFGEKEKIAIVGANGAGKTTLVKLLLRLYDPEQGSISFGGEDIKSFSLEDYRNIFSVVMQDYHIFSLSVAENLLKRGMTIDDVAIIENALREVDMHEKVKSFSSGINTVLTKEFNNEGELLSVGEQQKLAIAHIYTKKTQFVILDEPSSALDPISEYKMYEEIKKACVNCGLIFVSHRLSSAVNADYIYFIEQGNIVEQGTHTELMAARGKYAEMYMHQAENYR